ncbi:S-methyl-5-thioribose-1-phosphate isomerase [Methanoplanus sp. FWC-SCC4]|uniref:Putative methylthioribose-1-phosphate isomerase n=1 Tax=Methanochimaera problematica TaxID=2609417 RepID=A0AA97I3Z5_9EURY|nr:S-methyl-5-thioribose-1-phosphate isomerase [Methanoplanus sp. FWC-SCC4]WOF16421.1 S-methyl-5-thioribose-1-phosphate isomerase [Methanoplanus sp. FWC-SCC4]
MKINNDKTIFWNYDKNCIEFVEQTLLPVQYNIIECDRVERLAKAIKRLEVRGAPALGVAGAFGIALSCLEHDDCNMEAFFKLVSDDAKYLKSTRPTAVNLSWGITRVLDKIKSSGTLKEARETALMEAEAVAREDEAMCHSIGNYGAEYLPDKCTVLTHCNAGALACYTWGTALGVIRSAVKAGKDVSVISCETRPLNQGSRLTAWELSRDNIPVKTITDSTAAFLMKKGEIDAVIVGADRITPDAVFNKIGTYMHAVCARYHNIPFYVAAPYSTFDATGKESDIIIEERDREELAFCGNKQLMPKSVPAINYAFDPTPMELVTAIFTEKGVLKPPFTKDFPIA